MRVCIKNLYFIVNIQQTVHLYLILYVTGQPALDEEVHSDSDSMKVRIKLKGRKSESSSLSVRKNVKKLCKKVFNEDDEEEEEEVCNSHCRRIGVFGS
jgi:hypothetical protein